MDIYTIYKATNTITGLSYIGYTNDYDDRLSCHRSASKTKSNKFYNAINEYGWHSFDWSILYQSWDKEYCLNVMESVFIEEYDTYNNGYNSTLGGAGGKGLKVYKDRLLSVQVAPRIGVDDYFDLKDRYKCPHCGKVCFNENTAMRYHFDNCNKVR